MKLLSSMVLAVGLHVGRLPLQHRTAYLTGRAAGVIALTFTVVSRCSHVSYMMLMQRITYTQALALVYSSMMFSIAGPLGCAKMHAWTCARLDTHHLFQRVTCTCHRGYYTNNTKVTINHLISQAGRNRCNLPIYTFPATQG